MVSEPSIERYTRRLTDAVTLGLGRELSESEFLQLLHEAEGAFPNSDSAAFEDAIGGGWYVYTFRYVRGDRRKACYERAIQHWERACELEGIGKRRNAALYLARLYVDEAIVRNLPRGLELFREVYKDTRGYEPSLCSYVDGLFKAGEFDEAIRIGQDLHTRAIQEYPDPTQRPDAPIYLVAKAYRAKVKTCKKNGQLAEALETSNGLLATGVATDNDRSIHEGLLGSVR
jgi:tetratricopeptide (TPR) repeat protein